MARCDAGGTHVHLLTRRASEMERAEREDGQSGRGEERVTIIAERVEHPRADHRSKDAGHAPCGEQQPVVHPEIARSVEVRRRRGEYRELRAVMRPTMSPRLSGTHFEATGICV